MSIEEAMMGGIVFKGKKRQAERRRQGKDQSEKENLYHRPARFRLIQDEGGNPSQTRQQT